MDSILLSLNEAIDMGEETETYENEIASNIEDYSKFFAFSQIPLTTMCRILGKSKSPISFETSAKILSNYSNKNGKDALDLLKYLKTEHISYQQTLSLITTLSGCPLIDELRSTMPNNSTQQNVETENPFMSLVHDKSLGMFDDDDDQQFMTIFSAVQTGNLELVKTLIEKDSNNLSTRDRQVLFLLSFSFI